MARGGRRLGAGSKLSWKHGKTKTIRVPIVLADEILQLARKMDESDLLEFMSDYDTKSNVLKLDLAGISIFKSEGRSYVYLEDLVKAGYILKPDLLADRVRVEILSSR
jgi:hypothetical protein